MKSGARDHHNPLVTALKEAGFTVDGVVKQDKKTIITVSPAEQSAERAPKSEKETQPGSNKENEPDCISGKK